MTAIYSRDNAQITRDQTKWGSPCAVVTFAMPNTDERYLEFGTSSWHLQSSAGLPETPPLRSDGKPWTYHVHRIDGVTGNPMHGQWYGATNSPGLEASIDELIADLNEWEAGRQLVDRIDGSIYRLHSELEQLVNQDRARPRTAAWLREQWVEVEEAYGVVAGLLFEGPASSRPPTAPAVVPPLHSWGAVVGWLDRTTNDARLWPSRGSYRLRSNGWGSIPVLYRDKVVGEALRLELRGDEVWVFGLSEDPQIAIQINGGSLWPSPQVEPIGGIDMTGGVFIFEDGVQIEALCLMTPDYNPWRGQ